MSRSQRWLLGIALFIGLIAVGVYFFEWNLLREPIARRVEAATGRSFAINGNLNVQLSMRPRITVEGLVLGNPAWSSEPNMAEIGKLDFTVEAMPLLHGSVVFPEINLTDARVLLEKNREGAANWKFKDDTDESRPLPVVKALTIDRGKLAFRDPTIKTDVAVDVSSVAPDQPNAGMLSVKGRGQYKGMGATLEGFIGSVLALSSAENPYPIKLRAVSGSTKARVDGTLIDPLHLKGEEVSFVLEGNDMAQMFAIVGVPLPPTPPYKLAGHLTHSGDVWTFRKFSGTVGRSDLAGDFSVDRGQKPQMITADLVSRNLDMKDLGGIVGADRGEKPSPKPPPGDRVLPQEPFSLEKLRVANANVKFRGDNILTEKLPLDKMTTTLKLKDGVLMLDPLNFGVASGNVVSRITMDARQAVIKTHADVAVKQLHLDKLFPNLKLAKANAGLIGGRAKLDTTGNSMAKMLGSANGDMALIMEGGSVSELLVRLSNLDVAHTLAVLLTGDKQMPVRCLVTQLKGTNGVFLADPFVLDTGKAVVTGTGDVNFAEETLNLRLVSKPKDFSFASLRGPINVTGTFKNPNVRPSLTSAATRGAAAVALGFVTGGLGTLIPLLEFGGAKDSDCAALIAAAGGPPPTAPPAPAGKKVTAGK